MTDRSPNRSGKGFSLESRELEGNNPTKQEHDKEKERQSSNSGCNSGSGFLHAVCVLTPLSLHNTFACRILRYGTKSRRGNATRHQRSG